MGTDIWLGIRQKAVANIIVVPMSSPSGENIFKLPSRVYCVVFRYSRWWFSRRAVRGVTGPLAGSRALSVSRAGPMSYRSAGRSDGPTAPGPRCMMGPLAGDKRTRALRYRLISIQRAGPNLAVVYFQHSRGRWFGTKTQFWKIFFKNKIKK